ncbi:sperm flagellar protein 1-like isoform X2 [Choloepus didactylus]|uniref:sperm flagellar protein 1-like isoform X2 n=1 Tax=Choloepus didactylus TaxID=27675 RepID=UPI0018A00D44|nr:sperm flagellar protein 1-like isoform X2 [Choloepus didactylus]
MLGAARWSPPALEPLPPGALRGLYAWLDALPLSRPKRHLARDFSDGVMLAEIVKHFCPRLVDLHNYVPSSNTDQKLANWSTLNRKVLHKLRLGVSEVDIRRVVSNTPGAVEPILCALREKVEGGALGRSPPPAATRDPGPSGAGADGPWAACTHHAGLPSPTVPCCRKTLPSLGALEETGGCTSGGWDTARQPSQHQDPREQLLEDQEQVLAVLQEAVKILQMKVVKLERLVKLKDARIAELMRQGAAPQ